MAEAKKRRQKLNNARGGVIVPEDLQRGLFYAPYGHVSEKWE